MKALPLLLALGLAACAAEAPEPATPDAPDSGVAAADPAATSVGGPVPSGVALTAEEIVAAPETYDGKTVVVEGTVREVCQMAGCWLTLAGPDGRTIRVEVPRDETESYVFTFPKDVDGQAVRVAGMLTLETESVEDLRHYAEDGGASAAEVAAITEPRQTLVLTASGAELAEAVPATSPVAPA